MTQVRFNEAMIRPILAVRRIGLFFVVMKGSHNEIGDCECVLRKRESEKFYSWIVLLGILLAVSLLMVSVPTA